MSALDYLRPGDTLCVRKLDRFGRSVKQVLTLVNGLHEREIGLRILTGRLAGITRRRGRGCSFFTTMAVSAELERDMLRGRTMAGLAAAPAKGADRRPPERMDDDMLTAAFARRARGESATQIAKALGVSRASVYRHLRDAVPVRRRGEHRFGYVRWRVSRLIEPES